MTPLLVPKSTHSPAHDALNAPHQCIWYLHAGHLVYGVPAAAEARA